MKKIFVPLVFTAFFLFDSINGISQTFNQKRNSVLAGVHYAILGEGDYEGTMVTNQYNRQFFSFLELSPSLGYLASSRFISQPYRETYLTNHLLGDVSLFLVPVRTKCMFFKIGGGVSFRIRKEVSSTDIFYDEYGAVETVVDKESSFDTGYSLQAIIGANVKQRFQIAGRLALQYYNKGTQLAIFGLLTGYNF
ncbi:MAG: hypothetical protein EPO28_10095 [Saprospiraceae bacterium]|nr:MAG: hypothetical protein EPO28_10095 [Saprospiraceae bacterium]